MKFLKHGNAWSLTPNARMDVRDQLPAGCYTVCKNPLSGEYFLEEGEQFILPKKLYGKTVTGVIRSTFVISPDGLIEHAFYNVKATGHVQMLRRKLSI